MTDYRHYNHALGKEIHTKREYLAEVKKAGLEPYREQKRPDQKPYKLDRSSVEMINHAAKLQREGRQPEGRFKEALGKLEISKAPSWANRSQGGFHNEG